VKVNFTRRFAQCANSCFPSHIEHRDRRARPFAADDPHAPLRYEHYLVYCDECGQSVTYELTNIATGLSTREVGEVLTPGGVAPLAWDQ
jgi:hypothetical protein